MEKRINLYLTVNDTDIMTVHYTKEELEEYYETTYEEALKCLTKTLRTEAEFYAIHNEASRIFVALSNEYDWYTDIVAYDNGSWEEYRQNGWVI